MAAHGLTIDAAAGIGVSHRPAALIELIVDTPVVLEQGVLPRQTEIFGHHPDL